MPYNVSCPVLTAGLCPVDPIPHWLGMGGPTSGAVNVHSDRGASFPSKNETVVRGVGSGEQSSMKVCAVSNAGQPEPRDAQYVQLSQHGACEKQRVLTGAKTELGRRHGRLLGHLLITESWGRDKSDLCPAPRRDCVSG